MSYSVIDGLVKLLTPNFTEATEKISIWRKATPLTEKFKISLRKDSCVLLPSFAEIGKAEVAKRVRCIHHEKD